MMTTDAIDELYRREFLARAGARFDVGPAGPAHAPFLRTLFEETWLEAEGRTRGVAVPLPPPLMELQHRAREASYATAHPDARGYVATSRLDALPIGRVLIDWRLGTQRPVMGVDVAVSPAARAGAAGLHLLRAWLAVCDRLGRVAELHVLPHNPAHRLYRRLGFVELGSTCCPLSMQRTPRLKCATGIHP